MTRPGTLGQQVEGRAGIDGRLGSGVLPTALRRFAAARPDGPAVVGIDGAHSWRDVLDAAERYGADLDRLAGDGPSERPRMMLLPQRAASVALLAAVDGRSVILAAPLHGQDRLAALAHDLGADLLGLDDDDRLVRYADGGCSDRAVDRDVDGGDWVGVLTSGSTGTPKCARHTWDSLSGAVRLDPRYAEGRWLVGYPLAHFAGLQVVLQCLLNGGTALIPPDFSPRAALDLLIEHGATHLNGTPTYVRQILLAATPSELAHTRLRHVTLGGEITDQPLLDALAAALPVARLTHTYATTELGAVLSVSDGRAGFDAALLDGERLRLIDGELHVSRSGRAMLGYLGSPGVQAPDDGWKATGDLIEVRDGRAHFLGRAVEVINVGGTKVSPAVVEAAIRAVPGVIDVAVSGHRSSIVGQIVRARIVPEPTADPAAVREAIRLHCAQTLPSYMAPRLLELVERLDLTPSQKRRRSVPE